MKQIRRDESGQLAVGSHTAADLAESSARPFMFIQVMGLSLIMLHLNLLYQSWTVLFIMR